MPGLTSHIRVSARRKSRDAKPEAGGKNVGPFCRFPACLAPGACSFRRSQPPAWWKRRKNVFPRKGRPFIFYREGAIFPLFQKASLPLLPVRLRPKERARWGHRVREGRVRTSSRRQACSPPESFLKAEFILPHETAAWTSAFRSIIKYFPFEMLRLSNHTACRFAEKHGFFRALSAGGAVRRSAFYLFQR